MIHRPRHLQRLLYILVPVFLLLAGLAMWTLHIESIESTHAVPLPSIKSAGQLPAPTNVDAAIDAASTSAPPINAFHSKTIDAHIARLEAERIAAEKAAAEKAAAEKAAAEAAAAAAAAAVPVVEAPAPPPKKQYELVYHGMMDRVDGTLLAFIENRTEGTTFYYQQGDVILHGTLQAIHPRSITLQFGAEMRDIIVNEPAMIEAP